MIPKTQKGQKYYSVLEHHIHSEELKLKSYTKETVTSKKIGKPPLKLSVQNALLRTLPYA